MAEIHRDSQETRPISKINTSFERSESPQFQLYYHVLTKIESASLEYIKQTSDGRTLNSKMRFCYDDFRLPGVTPHQEASQLFDYLTGQVKIDSKENIIDHTETVARILLKKIHQITLEDLFRDHFFKKEKEIEKIRERARAIVAQAVGTEVDLIGLEATMREIYQEERPVRSLIPNWLRGKN